MSPLLSKRRKLSHDDGHMSNSPQLYTDEDHITKSSSNGSVSDVEQGAQQQPLPTPAKQIQENNNSALYAGEAYKSSIFKLQIDELLVEVRPDYGKQFPGLDNALRKLKGLVEEINNHEAIPASEASKLLFNSHKIAVPFPDPKPEKNSAYKLLYAKPSNINIVGSYALKNMIISDDPFSIDMIVVMPSSIFQEKDYLNYRYFYKRAYYLACIAAGLQESILSDFKLSFGYLNGNSLHPILLVQPRDDSPVGSDFVINIIPTAPQSLFPASKINLTKNSIRPKNKPEDQNTQSEPTPFYNSSLQSDCTFESYFKLLHSTSKICSGFKDACTLGTIWLRQRGFTSEIHKGGFGHFEWATLIALFLKGDGLKGKSLLSPGYSSYQLFKAILQIIASSNWSSKPLILESPDLSLSASDTPIMYDGKRGQNILYKMTPWSYDLLRDEAKTTLKMLNSSTFDQFESTFILRTDSILQRYDCLIRVPLPTDTSLQTSLDHNSKIEIFSRRMFQVLREGLNDRVKIINLQLPSIPSWTVQSSDPPLSYETSILVGMTFDTSTVGRLVDHGPAAEDKKKAAKFQKFWGEKAELRRFKDGSILESLVWSPGQPYSIIREIVTYLLGYHFNVEVAQKLVVYGEDFEKRLPGLTNGNNAFQALRQAFHTLEKNIRELKGLPLQLKQLSAIDSQLRHSSINAPVFTSHSPLSNPASVLIQFEGSGRWPDDICAIQRTKIAFLLKISELLQEVQDIKASQVGLENEDRPLLNCAFLDVFYESGATFRLRIHTDREETLLERQAKDKLSVQRDREAAFAALSTYKRLFVQLPLHTQSIVAHCTRFPLLSPSIRLVKIWFDRHRLYRHFTEEFIELLVARTFLSPYPWSAPSSTMTGFLRTLLMLSRWDWRLSPLVVDFTGIMTDKEVNSIQTRLDAWRKIDPGMNRTVILAASNHDMTGTAFTEIRPSKMIATRMSTLSRLACKLVKSGGLELDQRLLFASSTNEYDFVIHLDTKLLSSYAENDTSKHRFKNLEVQSPKDLSLTGYNPFQSYLNELEKIYGYSSIVFFASTMDWSTIAGLWNPQAVLPRSFKANPPHSIKPLSKLLEGQKNVELDKPAILSELARIGGDMVIQIDIC